jgi:hypothetical protein
MLELPYRAERTVEAERAEASNSGPSATAEVSVQPYERSSEDFCHQVRSELLTKSQLREIGKCMCEMCNAKKKAPLRFNCGAKSNRCGLEILELPEVTAFNSNNIIILIVNDKMDLNLPNLQPVGVALRY